MRFGTAAGAADAGDVAVGIDRVRCALALAGVRAQLVGNLANLLVALLLVREVLPVGVQVAWAAALAATLVLRVGLRAMAARLVDSEPARALPLFTTGSLLTGLVWGTLALLVPPFETFATGPYLVALFAGITAGAGALNATHRPTLVAFLAPVLGCVAWRFASALHPAGLALSGLVLLYGLLVVGTARRFERTFVDAHLLRLERERLVAELDRRARELEATSEKWRVAEARFRALADHAPVGIVRLDPEGRVVYANDALERSWGVTEDAGVLRELRRELAACRQAGERRELELEAPCGVRRVVVETVRLPAGEGQVGDTILWVQDVTVLTRTLAELEYLAHHDPLTRAANRKRFREELEARVAAARPGRKCALVLVDLDGFKPVNDRFGHAAGDTVLVEVARRLERRVRAGDLVARLGGDEFAVLVGGIEDADHLMVVARRIASAFDEPVRFEGRDLPVAGSIGIAVAPDHATEPNALLRAADSACYLAKEQPGTAIRLFAPGAGAVAATSEDHRQRFVQRILEGAFELRLRPWLRLEDGKPAALAVAALSVAGEEIRTADVLFPCRGRTGPDGVPERLFAAVAQLLDRLPEALPVVLPLPAAALHDRRAREALLRLGRAEGAAGRIRLLLEGAPGADAMVEASGEHAEAGVRDPLPAMPWFAGSSSGAPVELAALAERGAHGLILPPPLYRRAGEPARRALAHVVALARELGLWVVADDVGTGEERARLRTAGCELIGGDAVAPLLAPDELDGWLGSLPEASPLRSASAPGEADLMPRAQPDTTARRGGCAADRVPRHGVRRRPARASRPALASCAPASGEAGSG